MFAQESVMEIQKQKNLYLAKLLEQEVIKQDEFEDLVFKPEINAFHSNYLSSRFMDNINFGWSAWQAATAQAVPEGFVLVKKVHPDAIVHNQGLGLFKECQVIYGWDGKSKDFKEALNKGFYHGVKLGAKAVLETAMIEPQEPAND